MRRAVVTCLSVSLISCFLSAVCSAEPFFDPRADQSEKVDAAPAFANAARDPACYAKTLVSTGGAAPRDADTLVVRWAGQANFELAYKGSIILLDAWYDRGSTYFPLGFKAADVKKADLLLLGHGHFDHMADAASVASRTKAVVAGAPLTTDKLLTENVDPKQVRTVTGRGSEVMKFDHFTVEPILTRHGQPDKHVTEVVQGAINSVAPVLTPEQKSELTTMRAHGVGDKRVITEGTIAYLITLDDGFRIYYRDSGGVVTDFEKAVMARVGRVDLGILASSAEFLSATAAKRAVEYMHAYKPDVFMPAHHDGPSTGHVPVWRATEPLFQAMKNENPSLVTVSRGFREPVCFNTAVNIQNSK
jgi:L-ascorbate metabolism protein UlaG (beta-lactamase superfamily)